MRGIQRVLGLGSVAAALVAGLLMLTPPVAQAGHHNCPLSVGFTVNALPRGHRSISFGGSNYYYHGGHFYQPRGARFSIVAAPRGYRFSSLGHGHSSFYYGSNRYSRFHRDYYRWQPRLGAYVVVDNPFGRQQRPVGSQIFASAGQSAEQKRQDRDECQQVAAAETGYSGKRGAGAYEYEPVFRGCLEKRGYTVR